MQMEKKEHVRVCAVAVSSLSLPDAASAPASSGASVHDRDSLAQSEHAKSLSMTSTVQASETGADKSQDIELRPMSWPPQDGSKMLFHFDGSEMMQNTLELPAQRGNRLSRYLRWQFFSVYRKIFTIVFLGNLGILIGLVAHEETLANALSLPNVSTAAAANIFVAISVRNEHVINILFSLSTSLPLSWPLWFRRHCAKIYSYGGLHSSCGISGSVWYLLFAILVTLEWADGTLPDNSIFAITWATLGLLLLIIIFALPYTRRKLHDHFEWVHRFAGWTVLILFWIQSILTAAASAKAVTGYSPVDSSLGKRLVVMPLFWLVLGSSLCVIYPWIRLRHRDVRAESLSDHAVRLHFDHCELPPCSAIRLSDNPLKETHAFAAIPSIEEGSKYSVVISDAGDWTKRMVRNPPRKIWVRGAPVLGVIRIGTLFRKVVVVATGSGIGPCLSFFNGFPSSRCRILWSTRSPKKTYGQGIITTVLKTDPFAVIVDTDKHGRPDMVKLTYNMYKYSNAEAVVIISNPKVTRKVVFGMETRGIPAFGPIWDS